MIDKLDLRIPARTSLTPEFRAVLPTLPFRHSSHYKFTADLRDFLLNGILHYACRHGKERNHKLELIDTGVMTLEGLAFLGLRSTLASDLNAGCRSWGLWI